MKKIKMLFLCFFVFSFQSFLLLRSEKPDKNKQKEISEEMILNFLLQKPSLDISDKNNGYLKEALLNRLGGTSIENIDFHIHKNELKKRVNDILSSIEQDKNDSKKTDESFLDKIPIKFLFYFGAIVFVDYRFKFFENFKLKKIKKILEFFFNNKEDEKQKKYVPFKKSDGTNFLLNVEEYSKGIRGIKDFSIVLQRLCIENNICDLSLKKLKAEINGSNFEFEDDYKSLIEMNKLFEVDYGKSETRELRYLN